MFFFYIKEDWNCLIFFYELCLFGYSLLSSLKSQQVLPVKHFVYSNVSLNSDILFKSFFITFLMHNVQRMISMMNIGIKKPVFNSESYDI